VNQQRENDCERNDAGPHPVALVSPLVLSLSHPLAVLLGSIPRAKFRRDPGRGPRSFALILEASVPAFGPQRRSDPRDPAG